MTRMDVLLQNAVKCFRDTRSPFDASELSAQGVTLDEVYDLSNSVANAIEFYLAHKGQAVDEAAVRAVGEVVGPDAARTFEAQLKFNRTLKEFDKKVPSKR